MLATTVVRGPSTPGRSMSVMISTAPASVVSLALTRADRHVRGPFARPTCFRTRKTSKTSPSAYSDDSSQQGAKTQTVSTVTSKHELDELVKTASKEAKITVLEVAKLGSIGKEGKPRKSTAQVSTSFLRVATDFKDKAVFAALYIDHSEATKCAAESLKVREVPCVFIWDDQGELASELDTVSVDAVHHAVSRVLGVRDERG